MATASSLVSCSAAQREATSDISTQGLITGNKFLSQDGAGSLDEANAYYASNGVPNGYTLARWKTDNFGTATLVSAYYRNNNDLGFWRDMTCTQTVGRGVGGCAVTNYRNEEDKAVGAANLGTVAMNVTAGGITRFYAFGPDGTISPSVALDDEGQKFLPRVCTTCHGGSYDGSNADLGSIFREFEPSLFTRPSNIDAATQATRLFALNQAARGANVAVRAHSEGGPTSVDRAKSAENAYIDSIYAQTNPPVARANRDLFHLPPSWNLPDDPNATLIRTMWTEVVNPSCMGCHRTRGLDFSNYRTFAALARFQNGTPRIQLLTSTTDTDHDQVTPFMPHSQVTFNNLQNSSVAKSTIHGWTTALGGVSALDQVFFPQDCQSGALSQDQVAVLASFGDRGFPQIGEFVVQKRSCATRSTGDDCTPWEDAPCSDGSPSNDPACQEQRRVQDVHVDGQTLKTHAGDAVWIAVAQPDRTAVSWTVTMSGLPGASVIGGGDPAQVTQTCFRVPVPNQTAGTGPASHNEFRAALVVHFSSSRDVDPDANSPLNASSCTGPAMTTAQAESRFPAGSGLTRVPVPASTKIVLGQRTCQTTATGVTCTPFTKRDCGEDWCLTAAAASSISFVEIAAGQVALEVDAIDPALSVAVSNGAVTPGDAGGLVGGTVHATVTNGCFRIPFTPSWTGTTSGSWTEAYGAMLTKY